MGAADETRQLLQDFIQPELMSIAARLKRLEAKIDEHHWEVTQAINLANYQLLSERIAKLEARTR